MADITKPTTTPTTSIWDKLLRGVSSAVELRVVTVVGAIELDGNFPNPTIKFESGKTQDALATSINLAQGDITSVVPEPFWAPDKEAVRTYHQQQVQNGHEIVRRNLQLISEVGEGLAKALGQLRSFEAKSGENK